MKRLMILTFAAVALFAAASAMLWSPSCYALVARAPYRGRRK
jgi:hypothetical protein